MIRLKPDKLKPKTVSEKPVGGVVRTDDVVDHKTFMREYMRVKRAKERIPKLEAELRRLREIVKEKS